MLKGNLHPSPLPAYVVQIPLPVSTLARRLTRHRLAVNTVGTVNRKLNWLKSSTRVRTHMEWITFTVCAKSFFINLHADNEEIGTIVIGKV